MDAKCGGWRLAANSEPAYSLMRETAIGWQISFALQAERKSIAA